LSISFPRRIVLPWPAASRAGLCSFAPLCLDLRDTLFPNLDSNASNAWQSWRGLAVTDTPLEVRYHCFGLLQCLSQIRWRWAIQQRGACGLRKSFVFQAQ
jgi:hypothetical protein